MQQAAKRGNPPSNPCRGKRFFCLQKLQERLCSPPSLLLSLNQVISPWAAGEERCVREGRDVILTIHHQRIVEVKKGWSSSLRHMASRLGGVQVHCSRFGNFYGSTWLGKTQCLFWSCYLDKHLHWFAIGWSWRISSFKVSPWRFGEQASPNPQKNSLFYTV